jgi:addiction module RelE/StbE family toxin
VRSVKRIVKKRATLRNEIEQTLKLLAQDTFAPSLETHKLKGKLDGHWACNVGYDLRIVYDLFRSKVSKKLGLSCSK